MLKKTKFSGVNISENNEIQIKQFDRFSDNPVANTNSYESCFCASSECWKGY